MGFGPTRPRATIALSSNLRGIPRQIAMYQALSNLVAGVLLAAALTAERLFKVEELRRRHNLHQAAASAGSLSALHYATTLFERNVWLLRQLALWLREDAQLLPA